ncbi:STAS domain-containing protein [Blastococcus sp. PRF04-17]|uniref:STAS domain-containing protein n=1 Tax=Blastococcus sp. PRF04-17 TaxID=2933797 RepID=UPI001FF675F8|nr:STAS domain-containing protein [Blastococcus sp. PRF04-17]UOY01910.1 STAS domain-containing protein [Blastococcus sp. PRF04-17]
MLFDVGRTTIAGRPGLTVRGELDLSTAPLLATAVEMELAAAPSALVIDLTPTAFIDSSGARQLVRSARAAQTADVEVHIVCPRTNRGARLVIDLLDLGAIVPIVESGATIPPGFAQRDARP